MRRPNINLDGIRPIARAVLAFAFVAVVGYSLLSPHPSQGCVKGYKTERIGPLVMQSPCSK